MKTLKQNKEEISRLIEVLDNLKTLAESENRDFTEDEDTKRVAALDSIDALRKKNETLEREEKTRLLAASVSHEVVQDKNKEDRKIERDFDWAKAGRSSWKRESLDGIEKEMHQEGVREMKAIGQVFDERSILIPTKILGAKRANTLENGSTGIAKMSFIDHLYANTVLGGLADWNTGITDMRYPLLGEFATAWETEVAASNDGGNALSVVDLAPKRLAAYNNISKQANLQHGGTLSDALMRAAAKAVASAVESAVFTSTTSAPTEIKDAKTALTASSISVLAAKMVEEVAGNNGLYGNLAWIWSTDLISEILTAAGVTGIQQLFFPNTNIQAATDSAMGTINGYPVYTSSQLEVKTTNPVCYFGDWDQLKIAQFGAVELLLDPYTAAGTGMDVIHLNSYFDFAETKTAKISLGETAQIT